MAEKKYRSRDELLNTISDETNLTDAELQDRLDEYLYRQKNARQYVDAQKLGNEISIILASNGVPAAEIAGAVKMITDQAVAANSVNVLPGHQVVNGKNYDNTELGAAAGNALPFPGIGAAIGGGIGSLFGGHERTAEMNKVFQILSPIMPLINDKIQRGVYNAGDTSKDYDTDVKRIKDILEARRFETEQNTALDDFVTKYPSELAGQTNDIIKARAEQGKRFYEDELAPSIGQAANVRGTLYSGDYQNELMRGAADIQGTLESNAVDLQAQDSMFFADLAYQNTLRKAIQAGQDVVGQIATQRSQAETQKQQTFQSQQADINSQFQNQLFMRQNERALAAEQARLRNQQSQQRKAAQGQMYGQIGSAIGGIGGALAGGPAGAVVGSQVGGAGGGLANR